MPSYVTPVKNAEFVFYTSLVAVADANTFQTNPTLAAGDVKVSTDGGAESNLDTLPVVTPASSKRVKVTVSAAEMNGDNITITFSDAAGAEWSDQTINIQSTARQLDSLVVVPQKNTAFSDITFLWTDSSGVAVTGATGTSVTRSIDGAAFGAATGTLAEISSGAYQFDATAADMNGDMIMFRFVATGGTPGAPADKFITIKTGT